MRYTPLDFYPPTGPKGDRYIIEGKLQEFDGVKWNVVEDAAEQAAALAELNVGSADAPSVEPAPAVVPVSTPTPVVAKPVKAQ